MRAIILILAAAAIGLGALANQQAATIKDQQAQLSAAKEKAKTSTLAQQERCSNESQKWFLRQQYGINDLASYENHYNVKLDRCVVVVESKFFGKGFVIEFERIVNVFENRQFGTYVNQGGQLTHCTVTQPSGEAVPCKSAEEFKNLEKLFMEG